MNDTDQGSKPGMFTRLLGDPRKPHDAEQPQATNANTSEPQGPGFFGRMNEEAENASNFSNNFNYIVALAGFGAFFLLFAFLAIPTIVIKPQRFSVMLGGCFLGAIGFIRGFDRLVALLKDEKRIKYSAAYFGSFIGTLFFAYAFRSYFFSLIFAVFQLVSLGWLLASIVPGGTRFMAMCQENCIEGFKNCFSGRSQQSS